MLLLKNHAALSPTQAHFRQEVIFFCFPSCPCM